ncbi:MAG: FumA C-terminus/TtdB family hydratase beta subunit [Candidatus Asgardarchaeum sp.]
MPKEYYLKTPLSEDDVRQLKVGDIVYLSGVVVTARDEAHKIALEKYERGEKLPINFGEVAVYHCGPVIKKIDDKWEVVAAGPTTSTRMELFEDKFIKIFKTRMIIGKGGMGSKTTAACKEVGAIYAAFTGGAAILAANAIKKVKTVYWLEELGMPEALWVFEVENFGPLIVTIDAHGNNLFEDVSKKVRERRNIAYKMAGVD